MRNGFLGALAGWFAGFGLVFAQVPAGEVLPPGLPAEAGVVGGHDPGAALPLAPEGPVAAAVAGCAGPGCGGCAARGWGSLELLLWTVKNAPLPVPLLTQGNETLVTTTPLGALGTPTTSVVSPSQFSFGTMPGGRLTLGGWLDSEQLFGLECSAFILPQQKTQFSLNTGPATGTQALAVPLFDTFTNTETAIQLTFPATQPGATQASAVIHSQLQLWGFDLNGLYKFYQNNWVTCGALSGFRYLDLTESLQFNVIAINNSLVNPALPPTFPNSFVLFTDRFGTRNQFYGGQVGGHAEFYWSRFFLDMTGLVSLGPMHEEVTISGSTTTNVNGAAAMVMTSPITTPTGIFAQATNIGHHAQDTFAVVPEFRCQLGVEFWHHLRVFVGYNFLYASSVLRPGDQIDRGLNVNPASLPQGFPFTSGIPLSLAPPFRPGVLFSTSSFWAQGVNLGLEFKY